MDRDTQADDNGEHLYRWVAKHHPEIPAYFLLRRDSHDWDRLTQEGFQLIPVDSLRWKLAMLNAAHVISSHLDAYVVDPLPRQRFGDLMRWRFTFLQHGVIKHDMSRWLNMKSLDLMVTSTLAEHASIVGDDTPYKQTEREVRRTGLARHDALLREADEAAESPVRLLLMPTWRAELVGRKTGHGNERELSEAFYGSSFARAWKAALHDEALLRLAEGHGLRVTFMAHANMQDYLDWFDAPDAVETLTHAATSIQKIFVDTALLVTDYSSVDFDIALLQRPVIYFQFDREEFFGGGHLWRPGYFDYDRDGFGPVATNVVRLGSEIADALTADGPREPYLERMRAAYPEQDGRNCERIFHSIQALDHKRSGLPRGARQRAPSVG